MSDSETRSSNYLSIKAASKGALIQCPNCQTKFALAAEKIKEVLTPKFHCSRCDHIFGLEDSNAVMPASNDRNGKHSEEAPKMTTSPTPPTFKSLEIPKNLGGEFVSHAPHEIDHDYLSSAPLQMEFNLPGETRSSPSALPEVSDFKESEFSYESSNMAFSRAAPSQARMRLEYDSMENDELLITPAPATPWRSFAILCTPVFLFLALLIWGSMYLRSHLTETMQLTKTLLPNAPKPVPPGLYIKQANFKKVVLSNGEAVHLITGRITNSSDIALQDVEVEGLIFDESGAVLQRTRSSTASALADTKVRSLNREMIRDLQRSKGSKGSKQFELAPGDEAPFTLALLGENAADARQYSARIFWVRE